MYKQLKAAGLEDQIQVPLICLTLKFRLLTSGTSCHVIKAVGIWKKKNQHQLGTGRGLNSLCFWASENSQRLFASGSKHMKWGSGRKEQLSLSPGNRAECFSSLRTILMLNICHWSSPELCLHLQLWSPSKAITCGAGLQPPLPCPWLSSSQAPSVPMRAASWPACCLFCPQLKISLAHFPDLLLPFPPHCHVLLASSSSFTGRKIWRQEPRGGEEEEANQDHSFPLLFPCKSRHSQNIIIIFQPCEQMLQ